MIVWLLISSVYRKFTHAVSTKPAHPRAPEHKSAHTHRKEEEEEKKKKKKEKQQQTRETDRQRETQRETETETDKQRERERERERERAQTRLSGAKMTTVRFSYQGKGGFLTWR